MELGAVFQLATISALLHLIRAVPLDPLSPKLQLPHTNGTQGQNFNSTQSIDDLVQKQADTIKQIVSNHQPINHQQQYNQQPKPVDYPVVTKYGIEDYANHREKIKSEIDKLTLEELKTRCQQLSKLLANKTEQQNSLSYKISPPYYQHRTTRRPVNGFYITTNKPPTSSPVPTPATSETPPQNVKFIKLEPVILQKTVLSDGRTIYYWHKSLPTAAVGYPQYPQYPQTQTAPIHPQTSTTTTTTTTPSSSGYDFRNFFPSFYSIGGAEQHDPAATEKTTTTSTTTTTTERPPEELYAQQLRFVVPVPYTNADNAGVKHPWDFDQFAYYPKPLQPETVNVQVPYVPTFHIIKALAIPDKYQAEEGELDNVNI